MKTPAPADLQRWSEEMARDPASLAFLPLARAYRRMGHRSPALQLCLRGLQHYPNHAEAHSLLALLYLENAQHDRAADEWSTVLRLDPDNFDALRGLGFCYLEQDQLSRARHTLERAAALRPADPAVQEALRLLGTRQEIATAGGGSGLYEPWAEFEEGAAPAHGPPRDAHEPPRGAGTSGAVEAAMAPAAEAADVVYDVPLAAPSNAARTWDMPELEPGPARGATHAPRAPDETHTPRTPRTPRTPAVAALPADPTRLFAGIGAGGPMLGTLLLDANGLVLAGSMTDAVAGDADVLGAMVGGAIAEAARTAGHLRLGEWRGILIESERALLHLAPVGGRGAVLLAARRNAPAGWVLRVASQASELASRYLEAYA